MEKALIKINTEVKKPLTVEFMLKSISAMGDRLCAVIDKNDEEIRRSMYPLEDQLAEVKRSVGNTWNFGSCERKSLAVFPESQAHSLGGGDNYNDIPTYLYR